MDGLAPALPVPAGGMSLERVGALVAEYGRDVMLLIGGDLHRHGSLAEGCARFRALVEEAG
jgi:ribulose-bisphosphate carboxylase large chain